MLPGVDVIAMLLPLSSLISMPSGIEAHLARVVLEMDVDAPLRAIVEDDLVAAARVDDAEVVACRRRCVCGGLSWPFHRQPIT